jgi:mRNA interferase RelE/StbE
VASAYEVDITPEGLRHLNRLPVKVRDAALALMLGPLAAAPRRIGKPLVGELTGLWSARRGDYRVIVEIDDDTATVLVHRVQHRGDVYRPR